MDKIFILLPVKKAAHSYISFTRTERMGLVALCVTILLLITVKATMHLWAHQETGNAEEQRLAAAWSTYKDRQPKLLPDSMAMQAEYIDASEKGSAPIPLIININTADEATLVRLKGIGPVAAAQIIEYRTTKGPFTDIGQLKEVIVISDNNFEILKDHLSVGATAE